MDSSFTERWMRKFRIITLSLIFSGALNIGLIAAFIAMQVLDREKTFSIAKPRAVQKTEDLTNLSLLTDFSHLTFHELCALLTNTDPVEEGLAKRDLALSALVACHDFNLEKAIGSMPAQRRTVQWNGRALELYPGLGDDQYQAILHFAYLEKWPLTAHGLFKALVKSSKPRDETLVEAFAITYEFHTLQSLFQKSEASVEPERLIDLMCEGNWQILDGLVREMTQMMDFSPERRRRLLLSYLAVQSPVAADLLLQTDFMFALKRLDDKGLIDLLSLAQAGEVLQKFCIELLQSARGDAIYEKSAETLYRLANLEAPQPFDRAKAVARFVPAALKKEPVAAVCENQRAHIVQEGENLWKIARKYHVKLDDLIAINHLEKDRIKPGAVLKIPLVQRGL